MFDRRETRTTQDGVYCVYLFREDLTGVYLTFAVGVTQPRRAFGSDAAAFRNQVKGRVDVLKECAHDLSGAGFRLDGEIDLRATAQRGKDYEIATVAYRLYESNALPDDKVLINDLESVLSTYDKYLAGKLQDPLRSQDSAGNTPDSDAQEKPLDLEQAVRQLVLAIEHERYVFEPWQIAAYVTALRTKPLVILAGVTGTGKSTLPRLVAAATGGTTELVPVRPDWTDSSDILGYTDLRGEFRPGVVLGLARRAMGSPNEQYLAEILSRVEDHRPSSHGGFQTTPLLTSNAGNEEWMQVVLPANFALVALARVDVVPPSYQLGPISDVTEDDRRDIRRVIAALSTMNAFLTAAQLQVGYGTRDEIALFVPSQSGDHHVLQNLKQ